MTAIERPTGEAEMDGCIRRRYFVNRLQYPCNGNERMMSLACDQRRCRAYFVLDAQGRRVA